MMLKKSSFTAKCCIFLILICKAVGDHIIGGIFDEDHDDDRKAFEAAIKLVNLQRNDDQQLKPAIEVLEPYNMFKASSIACKQLEEGAITIFGPYNPDNFEAIQSICDAKEVPVIQTRWNHRPQRDSSIMNFYPHTSQLSMAYVEIIKKLEWNHFILFYDDDESFLRLLDLMKLSQDKEYLIITRQLDPDDSGIYREQFREISDSPVNNIVIDCRLEVLQEVLRQAQQLGLMNKNYNYFITNLDFHTIDMEPFQYSNTNITGVKLIKSDSKMTTDFIEQVESEKKEDDDKEFSLKTSSALIADAMFMLSDALSYLEEGATPTNEGHGCDTSGAWEFGLSLVNFMRTIKTEGRTGMMKFDNEGFRSDFTLVLTEVQERGMVDIGYWNMSEGAQIQRPSPYPMRSRFDDDEDETSLVNKTLIVITALTEPYTFLKDSSEKLVGNDRYEGFGVDLIDEMAKLEKFNYIIVLRKDKSNGARNAHGQWSGMIGDLMNRTADLAIADLTINSERAEAVDFTTPFMELGIKILFQKPTAAPPNFFSFAEPFAIDTWLSIAVSYVFVSLSLFIMGRLSASEWTNPFPCIEEPEYLINQFSLSNSFWFSTGTGLQQGTEIAPICCGYIFCKSPWINYKLVYAGQ